MTDVQKFEMIVGLEVHAELRTESKIFCACRGAYGALPNTQICPVCMGHPGTLPVLNEQAVRLAIAAGLVTDCRISPKSHFDRKNYFYPDLPKGYQITQYDTPLCRDGRIDAVTEDGDRQIRINRIHLEEDAGKLIHGENGTKIDYNRCGVPLIEIVSEPDIRSAEEAKAYLRALRERLVFAGISDCKMNEGSMRCDVNLSVRRVGDTSFGTRTEIKNVNSIAFVGKAIEYEFARQCAILAAGDRVTPQTRRYDEASGTTVLMREKESAADYRYLREPDLPEIVLADEEIEAIRRSLPPMPAEMRARFIAAGLSADAAFQLTESPVIASYFGEVLGTAAYPAAAANLLIGEILPRCAEQPTLPAHSLGQIADLLGEKKISAASARRLCALCENGEEPSAVAQRENMLAIIDPSVIASFVRNAMEKNESVVSQIRAGKEKAKQVLVGAVMKESRGRADAAAVLREIDRQIEGM